MDNHLLLEAFVSWQIAAESTKNELITSNVQLPENCPSEFVPASHGQKRKPQNPSLFNDSKVNGLR
jgi:hypothetical protein